MDIIFGYWVTNVNSKATKPMSMTKPYGALIASTGLRS
jgi:hypothetical protein